MTATKGSSYLTISKAHINSDGAKANELDILQIFLMKESIELEFAISAKNYREVESLRAFQRRTYLRSMKKLNIVSSSRLFPHYKEN